MCLKVYPNGYGDVASTHMSVYNYIMRGPFDNQLKWPFRGDVTVRIDQQKEDDNHIVKTITYTETTNDDFAGRVTDRERSFGFGWSKFIPHSSLDLGTTTNVQYLLCDTLYIQVVKVTCKE